MENKFCSHKDCRKKLKPIDTIMGVCRCEKVFCKKHRMPESHECQYVFKLDKDKFIEANLCIAAKV